MQALIGPAQSHNSGDNQSVDCRQMAPTLSLLVRVIMIQFLGCGDSLSTFYLLQSSLVSEITMLRLRKILIVIQQNYRGLKQLWYIQ